MQLYETRSLQRRFRKDALLNKYLSDERAQSSKINFSDLNWHEVDIQVLDWIWSSDFVHRDRGMYVRALTRRVGNSANRGFCTAVWGLVLKLLSHFVALN